MVRNLLFTPILLMSAATGAPPQSAPAGPVAWAPVVDSGTRLSQLFARPPAAFSTAPFFVWNGDVKETEIDEYLSQYHSLGIDSFIIHPRPGLITPYLSDRWLSLVRHAVDKAKQLGMKVWLYDENSYPSGFAGGHVPADMPESYNEGQGLTLRKLAQVDPAVAGACKLVLKRDGGAFRDVTSQSSAETGRVGEYYCFELTSYPKRDWNAGFSYVDLIRPGVTEKFIDVTMGAYQRTLKGDLGGSVLGVFSDEPNINPPSGANSMRWTPDLFAEFQKRAGDRSARACCPSFTRRPAIGERSATTITPSAAGPLHRTLEPTLLRLHRENDLAWTGHYWEHAWPNPARPRQHGHVRLAPASRHRPALQPVRRAMSTRSSATPAPRASWPPSLRRWAAAAR